MYDDGFDLQFQHLASKPVPMSIVRYFRCQPDMGKKERSFHIFSKKRVQKKEERKLADFVKKEDRSKFFKKEISIQCVSK